MSDIKMKMVDDWIFEGHWLSYAEATSRILLKNQQFYSGLRILLKNKQKWVKADPPPIYDDIYYEGVEWLDKMGGGEGWQMSHQWNHTERAPHQISISIDFDGCLVTHAYPKVGKDAGAWPYLKKLYDAGCKLMLNTARSSADQNSPVEAIQRLQDAISYTHDMSAAHGLHIDTEQMKKPGKLHAFIFLDDHNLGIPTVVVDGKPCVNWDLVGPWLLDIAGIK